MGEPDFGDRLGLPPAFEAPDAAMEILLICPEEERARFEVLGPQLHLQGLALRILVTDDGARVREAMAQSAGPCVVGIVVGMFRTRAQARAGLEAAAAFAGPGHRVLVLDVCKRDNALSQVRELSRAAESLLLTLDLHHASDAALTASASMGAASAGTVIVQQPAVNAPVLRIVQPLVVVAEGLSSEVISAETRTSVKHVDAPWNVATMPTYEELPAIVDEQPAPPRAARLAR